MALYNIKQTTIDGCFEIEPRIFKDSRGAFIKIYHQEEFNNLGLCTAYEEEYVSVSSKGVLRGLHFQTPPDAHIKLVSCLSGRLLDVVVDLRKNSKTYGEYYSLELSSEKGNLLYVPKGLAHGFYSYTDNTVFISMNSKKFAPDSDSGIHWDSFGFNWPEKNPIVSEKDMQMPMLEKYKSPF